MDEWGGRERKSILTVSVKKGSGKEGSKGLGGQLLIIEQLSIY